MNYSNLNDIEFEDLCRDVMSKMLGVNLERYTRGKDDGIDLTDDARKKNIIVQVKHYQKSSISQLISALKEEVPKVKKAAPKQYYVCCSKELTPKNKQEIWDFFSDYMDSTANIVTALEISDFLSRSENADILRKHFKLWIDSTNVLTEVLSNNIFIDSNALLCGIDDEKSLFVRTKAFDEALCCLERKNILIIVGNPGVGKTITSKMLVLHFAANGYRVRYTTDGGNLNELKKSLSQSPEAKEIILLDDCFGQAYFNMKETQENELLLLIKHISVNPNKLLIMNSRVTIFEEAKSRTPALAKSVDKKEFKLFLLNVDNLSTVEKAKIFYNHLYFSHVPPSHYQKILCDKNYRKIVKHPNYNPRIIEFVCSENQFNNIGANEYVSFLMKSLDNPEQIWKNEYERRLLEVDRMLLTTLFSLSDTAVSMDMVKRCFEQRLLSTTHLDSSINQFEQAVTRMSNSLIKIIDMQGETRLSVANPSINDFLRNYVNNNQPEVDAIAKNCKSVRQLKRLLGKRDFELRMQCAFADHTILDFIFENNKQKKNYIASYCAINQVLDVRYTSYIIDYLHNVQSVDMYENCRKSSGAILKEMLQPKFAKSHGIDGLFKDVCSFYQIVDNLSLEDQVEIIKGISWMFDEDEREDFIDLAWGSLRQGVEAYCYDVFADEYDVDVSDVIDDCIHEDEWGEHIDGDGAADEIRQIVEAMVIDEVREILSALPADIDPQKKLLFDLDVSVSGASSLVENFLQDNCDVEHYAYQVPNESDDVMLDYIFNRNIYD